MSTFDLAEVTRADLAANRFSRVGTLVAVAIVLPIGVLIEYSVATGRVNPQVSVISAALGGAAGIVLCLFLTFLVVYPYFNGGLSRVTLDKEGVTLTSYRGSRVRTLRWASPTFYLRLAFDRWSEGRTQCLEYTDTWAPRPITEECFDEIVEAAKRAGMAITEKRVAWGIRTLTEIRGPARPGESA